VGGVRAFRVVISQPLFDTSLCVCASFKGVQIDAFILQRPPEALNHSIVDPAAFSVHADLDLRISQNLDPISTCELAVPLPGSGLPSNHERVVGVEYLRRAVLGQRLFQGLDAEFHIHRVGQPPCKYLATVPVHDGHNV